MAAVERWHKAVRSYGRKSPRQGAKSAKNYVLGTMFNRFISENVCSYINNGEFEACNKNFNFATMLDDESESMLLKKISRRWKKRNSLNTCTLKQTGTISVVRRTEKEQDMLYSVAERSLPLYAEDARNAWREERSV